MEEGQLALTVDTGEIFIGSPRISKFSSTAARNDGNVRILTELDQIAQPPVFSSVNLPVGGAATLIAYFYNGLKFSVIDYGLTDAVNGPFLTSTINISGTTINDNSFNSPLTTFVIGQSNGIPVLRAINHGSNIIMISYCIRSLITS